MIWIKRFSPLLVILLLWLAYTFYITQRDAAKAAKDQKIAALSAQMWVATARYRENPREYEKFRDSLLRANDLDDASIKKYVGSLERDPDRQLDFSTVLSKTVDSLVKIEDSTRKANARVKPDSPKSPIVTPTAARDSLVKRLNQIPAPTGTRPDTTRPR